MRKILLFVIAAILVITLYACSLFNPPATEGASSLAGDLPALSLAVQGQSGTYNAVGQTIPYTYTVTNLGNPQLAGPVTIVDDKMAAACPAVNTVGNKDDNLDTLESLTCSATYTTTQADLNAGAVTSNAIAKAGGIDSNTATTKVQMTLNKVLLLTYVATPTTYSQTGQTINFTYSIKNTGTAILGPAQFVINDDRLGAINCLSATTILAPNESVSCPATYTTTINDTAVNQLTFNGVATGGGAGTNQPASIIISNTNVVANPGTPSNYTRGSTIQHKVTDGEWMLQIARCYGADYNAVRSANLQVLDPNKIWPINTLTVPNIGSTGTIYGPPCVTYYTAQSGDTWNTIAQKFNADLAVLQEANKNGTVSNGTCVKVPLNSAGGTSVLPLTITPCSGGTTPPSTSSTIRINIPAGSTSTTISGSVTASGKVRYVFGATQGQALSVKLNAPVNEVSLGITAANGSVLKTQDATLTFAGTIPATGDSYIDIFAVSGASSKSFTLEISITTPAAASPFERVADINSGAGDSGPAYLAVFNGAMYFRATGSDNTGAELWKYDPGLKAVSRIADINPGAPGSDPSFLTAYNSALYFSANNNDGAGVELFRFNGSAVGRAGDTNPGAGNANPAHMAVYKDLLYFSANGNDGAGIELWKTDGTTINRAADIHAGTGDSNPSYLTVYKDMLYFSATSTDGGTELWKFDGTTATLVWDINPGVGNSNPSYLAVFNNMLYFSANGNDSAGTELWRYDGTSVGRVADINPGTGDSGPTFLTVFSNALYFSATGDSAGIELWKYDGTSAKRISDLNTAGSSNPAFLTAFDNALFFQANGGDGAGVELWKFKGP